MILPCEILQLFYFFLVPVNKIILVQEIYSGSLFEHERELNPENGITLLFSSLPGHQRKAKWIENTENTQLSPKTSYGINKSE